MTEWVTDIVDRLGYVGVAFLVALESVFPPIPSEIILPLAGFVAGQGDANFLGMVARGDDRLAGRGVDPLRHLGGDRPGAAASVRRPIRPLVRGQGRPIWSVPRNGSTGDRRMPCCSGGACR